MPEPAYLTAEGLARIKAELEELTGPSRTDLAARLRSAIQMGDLSENADYHKAKEDQGFLEGRIQELEYLVRHAVVIDENAKRDTVGVGSHITIQEADPRNGRISHESPIGRALMGHRVGDNVEVETPAGKIKFKILKIE